MRHLVLLALALPSIAIAVPLELSHQGRLFDSAGLPLDGAHHLDFALYDAPSGGTAIWSESFTGEVFDDGYFSVTLGSSSALATDDFDDDDLWLGLTVDAGSELPTRIKLSTSPFAVRASVAESVSGGIDWSQVTGLPAGIDDGDDDTLATVTGCSADDVLVWDGSAWTCSALASPSNLDASVITTGVFGLGRLPVGTGSGDVAAGDHSHTAADVGALPSTTTAADIGALPDTATASDVGALDIAGGTLGGSLTLGGDASTCDSSHAGAMRWTGSRIEICVNDQWTGFSLQTGSPAGIPGLLTWVMADAGVVTSTGTNVAQWTDQSGNGNHWTQSTASQQPDLQTGQLNGLPVLTHVASRQDTLSVDVNFPAPATVIYVGRHVGGANSRMLSGLNNNWLLGFWGGGRRQAYHEGWISPSGSPGSDTAWHMWTSVMTGSASTIYEDRNQLFSNSGGVTGPNGLCTSGHLCTSEFSNGQVAEIAVYDGALDSAQLSTVWSYLENKWGL